MDYRNEVDCRAREARPGATCGARRPVGTRGAHLLFVYVWGPPLTKPSLLAGGDVCQEHLYLASSCPRASNAEGAGDWNE